MRTYLQLGESSCDLLFEVDIELCDLFLLVLDDTERLLVELHEAVHHADTLLEWAELVVVGVGVLCEVVLSDDPGGVENQLLVLGERVSADQLHDLLQLTLRLEELTSFGTILG